VSLEDHARQVSQLFSIDIDIYGFDTGEGLPSLLDYRDLPYHWKTGHFKWISPSFNHVKEGAVGAGGYSRDVERLLPEDRPLRSGQ